MQSKRKGLLTEKQLKRFPVIDRFVKRKKRLPLNYEIVKMFRVGLGATSKEILEKYIKHRKNLKRCPLCHHFL